MIGINYSDYVNEHFLKPQEADTLYINSPFRNLKDMHPKTKGMRFEQIVKGVIQRLVGDPEITEKPISSDHDVIFKGKKIEIKGSLLDRAGKKFSFLQIRPNQDVDYYLFAMFYPQSLMISILPKSVVKAYCEDGTFAPQHGGKDGDSGTFSYFGNVSSLCGLGAIDLVDWLQQQS